MEGFIVSLIIFTAVFAVFSLGLNLQWGCTGLINFGHVAFMTVGAYTTVLLSVRGVPLLLAAIAGGGMAALLGLLIGFTTLRLRTDYLAIVTVGVSELIRLVAVNEEWLTRGTFGLQGFPLPLAEFMPDTPSRHAMVALFTLVIGWSYWHLGRWLWPTVRSVPRSALGSSVLAAIAYLGSLTLLLGGVGIVARELKLAGVWSPWLLGLFLLLALGAIAGLFFWISQRILTKLAAWSAGLSVVCTGIVASFGLWMYWIAVNEIVHYDRNPSKTGLMVVSVMTAAAVFWALEQLMRSPWGRVLKAIREDEEVVKALGKPVFWYKLQSLMLGGAIAGIAGALYAWQLTTVYPDNFQPLVTFNAWTIVVLGGAGSNAGTLLGSAIFWAYQTLTRFVLADIIPLDESRLAAFRIMLIGLLLMVLMVWRPQGILGKKEELTLGR